MSKRNRLNRNLGFFAYIPSEIIIEILSKLPVRSVKSCKCVCKSWLNLLESHEFVKSHLLKSIPGLAVYRYGSNLYELFEFEDGLDLEHHRFHYKPVTKVHIPGCDGWICGSANGLLFLCNMSNLCRHHFLHICNPITCDYIRLDCTEFVDSDLDEVTYGFGSSKITGQYKVVRIFQDSEDSECVCHVYTIGSGLWRRISPVTHLVYDHDKIGAFLNGNLHWTLSNSEDPRKLISCFDLETERFSTFSSPVLKTAQSAGPTVLEDCLCLCDDSLADGIVIWLMKEYGVEKSWTKQFFIGNPWPPEAECLYRYHDVIYPIKVFKDGDILLVWKHEFRFSKKENTLQRLKMFGPPRDINALLYTPSFLSLTSFGMEKVFSF